MLCMVIVRSVDYYCHDSWVDVMLVITEALGAVNGVANEVMLVVTEAMVA